MRDQENLKAWRKAWQAKQYANNTKWAQNKRRADRERERRRYQSDPAYREDKKTRMRARMADRYRTDPEFRERKLAAEKERMRRMSEKREKEGKIKAARVAAKLLKAAKEMSERMYSGSLTGIYR